VGGVDSLAMLSSLLRDLGPLRSVTPFANFCLPRSWLDEDGGGTPIMTARFEFLRSANEC
jgi:hypothetical protein